MYTWHFNIYTYFIYKIVNLSDEISFDNNNIIMRDYWEVREKYQMFN